MMNKLLILTFIILAFIGCQEKANKTDNEAFVIDILDTSITHFPNLSYEIKKRKVDELNLNRLENGADSFELRLWSEHAMLNGGDLFIIKQINNNWTCLVYLYRENKLEPNNPKTLVDQVTNFIIDSFVMFKITPKSGWQTFLKKIKENKIYELPDQRAINGFEIKHGDGLVFHIEYATKNKYKFYTYFCPDLYGDKYIENKYMSNILEIFNKEFGLGGNNGNRCKPK